VKKFSTVRSSSSETSPLSKSGALSFLHSDVRASVGTLTSITRTVNEDSVKYVPGRFGGIADGVSGGAHGELVSHLLMQTLPGRLPSDEISAGRCLSEIDRSINDMLGKLGAGPGATVFAAVWPLISSLEWQALWVGDCQITHYQRSASGWHIVWQSLDQTYENNKLVPPLGTPPSSPNNMVGCGMSTPPAWQRLSVHIGDRIVISSDGFHKALTNTEKLNLIREAPVPLSLDAAQQWCHFAQQRGSVDDISVLVIEIAGDERYLWRFIIPAFVLMCLLLCALYLIIFNEDF
jgi:serine/threonine protein phosphatase PrpC